MLSFMLLISCHNTLGLVCMCVVANRSGFADSKTLQPHEREKLFRVIENESKFTAFRAVLSAEYLSKKMLMRTKKSLNSLSYDAIISLVNKAIAMGYNITQVTLSKAVATIICICVEKREGIRVAIRPMSF